MTGWAASLKQGQERHRCLVRDYLQAVGDGKSALIIAATHAEGARLTAELRGRPKEQNTIGKALELAENAQTDGASVEKAVKGGK